MQLFSGFIVVKFLEVLIPRHPSFSDGGRHQWWSHLGLGVWVSSPLSIDESVFATQISPQITLRSSSSFPITRDLMTALMVFKNNLLRRSYGRRGGGTRYEKGMDIPLYFYQVQNYQSQKKA